MAGPFSADTWLTPITFAADKTLVLIEDPGGGAESTITLTVSDDYTYYLHNDSSFNSSYVGLYYALEDALNNGTNTWVTVSGTVTNTYAFTASTPASSSSITNAGITLTASTATYTFKIDWTSGSTIDGRLLGFKDEAPTTDESSVTSGSDEVYISDYCVRQRLVTYDRVDGAAISKTELPRKITQRSTDRVADSVTTNWGEESDRWFVYEDIWPAHVDPNRAGDTPYATNAGLAADDKNNTWYVVWDALSDGDTCIVVHNSTSDLQVDAHSYEVVKLAEERPWQQFQSVIDDGGDFRRVDFIVYIISGTYEH